MALTIVYRKSVCGKSDFVLIDYFAIMSTDYRHAVTAELSMEDSGNSCGSSVVSEFFSDSEGVQVSDLEVDNDLHFLQVGERIIIRFMFCLYCGWIVQFYSRHA